MISVIAALFYQSCQGNGGNSRTSHNDAGTSDAGAAPDASYDQTDHSGCYPPRRKELEELQKKLVTCETDRDSYKSKLEACLQENEELSKRPRYCTAPKVCPPVNECPQLPYIRKGD